MNTTTLTANEAQHVAEANASGKQPIIFVHGLWLLASSWKQWREYFESRGFATVAVEWPGDAADVELSRRNPDTLAGLGVQEIADHVAAVADALDRKAIAIGHSFGGLLVQKVAGTGRFLATVAIDPAPFRGVLPLPVSALKAAFPALGRPSTRHSTVTLTREQFRYAFANAVTERESDDLYEQFHVAGPGRPLFQVATANLNPRSATSVSTTDPRRGPLLVISGQHDHTVPHAMAFAAYRLQSRNPGVTEFSEIPGRGHSLVIDAGWADVADAAHEFATRALLDR